MVLTQSVDKDERTCTGAQYFQQWHPRPQMSTPHWVSWIGIVRSRSDAADSVAGDDQTGGRNVGHQQIAQTSDGQSHCGDMVRGDHGLIQPRPPRNRIVTTSR